MPTPLTVIIPTLNESAQIAECVGQLAWSGEVIVSDGGSSDGTLTVAPGAGGSVPGGSPGRGGAAARRGGRGPGGTRAAGGGGAPGGGARGSLSPGRPSCSGGCWRGGRASFWGGGPRWACSSSTPACGSC